jgi:hypothetical protein
MAKQWIPTYTGKNIVRGYKNHFALSPLGAVADLQILGHEISPEYIEQLKIDELNRINKRKKRNLEAIERLEFDNYFDETAYSEILDDDDEFDDSWLFAREDESVSSSPEKKRKFKNHEFVGGRLLQTNKKFSQLKEKQKSLIAEWFFIECDQFHKKHNKFPKSKLENDGIIELVYDRIEARDIWIPFGEIKQYFSKKRGKLEKRVLKGQENVQKQNNKDESRV